VGGGSVALELGQLSSRLGSTVTVLERSARPLPAHEPDVSASVAEILQAEGVDGVTGAVRVDEFLRTTAPGTWAAGDVIGPHTDSHLATPVGAHDGVIVADNALGGRDRRVDHSVIPRTIFTDPQVATVGLTETETVGRGHRCSCSTVPLAVVPLALT
jgi:mercuric reductase